MRPHYAKILRQNTNFNLKLLSKIEKIQSKVFCKGSTGQKVYNKLDRKKLLCCFKYICKTVTCFCHYHAF